VLGEDAGRGFNRELLHPQITQIARILTANGKRHWPLINTDEH